MNKSDARLPITVLSGFLDAGKTTLRKHLVTSGRDRRLAVLVTTDGVKPGPSSSPTSDAQGIIHAPERYDERTAGSRHYLLREDLLIEVSRIARSGRFDYLIIETPGLSHPLPIAQTLAFRDPSGYSLGDFARLDTLVTVLDAAEFLPEFLSGDVLGGLPAPADDECTTSHLLALQVEYSNVLVLNKTDRVSASALSRLQAICRHLNPAARMVATRFGRAPVEQVLGTGLFDFSQIKAAPGWLQMLRGEPIPDSPHHGISSFVYRSRRPFHPLRLWRLIHGSWPEVLECKGYFWLATRMNEIGAWSQAGPVCHATRAGWWWAAVPRERWPTTPGALARIEQSWAWPYGDRRQELAIIGINLDRPRLRHALNGCLLTKAEVAMGPDTWAWMTDPFPPWDGPSPTRTAARTLIRNR